MNEIARLSCIDVGEKRIGGARAIGSRRATDPMNVVLRGVGIIKVYDILNVRHVCDEEMKKKNQIKIDNEKRRGKLENRESRGPDRETHDC